MIQSRASEACRLNVVSALRPAAPAVSFLALRHAGVLRIRLLATPSGRFLGRPSPIFMLTFPSAVARGRYAIAYQSPNLRTDLFHRWRARSRLRAETCRLCG